AAISAFHGQIDSVAILPAVAALSLWDRRPADGAAPIACGLLLGIGGALKTVPLLVLFALLPSARSRWEGAKLTGAALVLPVLSLVPFAASDFSATFKALRYRGLPGIGGLSLVVQPRLARAWISQHPVKG